MAAGKVGALLASSFFFLGIAGAACSDRECVDRFNDGAVLLNAQDTGRYPEAAAHFRAVLAANPGDDEALRHLRSVNNHLFQHLHFHGRAGPRAEAAWRRARDERGLLDHQRTTWAARAKWGMLAGAPPGEARAAAGVRLKGRV